MREHDAATAAYLQEVRAIERELAAGRRIPTEVVEFIGTSAAGVPMVRLPARLRCY